jgi:hypothetical protein
MNPRTRPAHYCARVCWKASALYWLVQAPGYFDDRLFRSLLSGSAEAYFQWFGDDLPALAAAGHCPLSRTYSSNGTPWSAVLCV